MENDISSADSAVLAANDLELRQKEEEEKGGAVAVAVRSSFHSLTANP